MVFLKIRAIRLTVNQSCLEDISSCKALDKYLESHLAPDKLKVEQLSTTTPVEYCKKVGGMIFVATDSVNNQWGRMPIWR